VAWAADGSVLIDWRTKEASTRPYKRFFCLKNEEKEFYSVNRYWALQGFAKIDHTEEK